MKIREQNLRFVATQFIFIATILNLTIATVKF